MPATLTSSPSLVPIRAGQVIDQDGRVLRDRVFLQCRIERDAQHLQMIVDRPRRYSLRNPVSIEADVSAVDAPQIGVHFRSQEIEEGLRDRLIGREC